MIKVIQYGLKRRVKCEHCKSVLEFEKDDIKTVQLKIYEFEKQFICPVCMKEVIVKE